MSKNRLGPEAKIINLFAALSEDSKRIVLDVIKSQSASPRKLAKKSSTIPVVLLKEPEAIPSGLCSYKYVGGSICVSPASNAIHDPKGGYAGYHEFEGPKPVARAPRKSNKKSESVPSIPNIEGETENVLATSSGGD